MDFSFRKRDTTNALSFNILVLLWQAEERWKSLSSSQLKCRPQDYMNVQAAHFKRQRNTNFKLNTHCFLCAGQVKCKKYQFYITKIKVFKEYRQHLHIDKVRFHQIQFFLIEFGHIKKKLKSFETITESLSLYLH